MLGLKMSYKKTYCLFGWFTHSNKNNVGIFGMINYII